jgi:type I restriction enzyme S subunit
VKTVPLIMAAEVALGRQRAPQYETGDHLVPYLRSANIVDGRLNLGDVKTMNFTLHEQRIFGLQPGDVLITEGSGSRETVGASAVWHGELGGTICFQNTLLRLRPRRGLTDGRYLAWWARHAHASGLMAAVASGANILHLGAENLRRLPISLPPLEEQRRSADFLDDQVSRIDRVVRMRQEQSEALVARRQAVAWAEVTGSSIADRAPSELAWVDSLPRHWRVARLSLLASMGTGHTPSRSEPAYWVDCTIPWLTTSDVHLLRDDRIESLSGTAIQISELGLANSAAVLHPSGTVALSRTASAGFSIVMDVDMATSQDFVTWTCGPMLDNYYLLWVLRAMRPDLLGRLAIGSTHKTIYFPDLESIRIPLPPMAEQKQAVQRIRDENELTNRLSNEVRDSLRLLEKRKRSLITATVMGEFDVTTASPRASAVGAGA